MYQFFQFKGAKPDLKLEMCGNVSSHVNSARQAGGGRGPVRQHVLLVLILVSGQLLPALRHELTNVTGISLLQMNNVVVVVDGTWIVCCEGTVGIFAFQWFPLVLHLNMVLEGHSMISGVITHIAHILCTGGMNSFDVSVQRLF